MDVQSVTLPATDPAWSQKRGTVPCGAQPGPVISGAVSALCGAFYLSGRLRR